MPPIIPLFFSMIAILTGGTSNEREIAIRSSRIFQRNIPDHDYFIFPEDLDAYLSQYRKYELVIPVFHGTYGEDGQIFAFLKTLGVRTAFSSFETHSLAIDKFATDAVVGKIAPVPRGCLYRKNGSVSGKWSTFPAVVKPNRWGSTIATSVVKNEAELNSAIRAIHGGQNDDALVQSLLPGREFTVSLLGNDAPEVLGITEICNKNVIFDFEEKYSGPEDFEVCPAKIDSDFESGLRKKSLEIYRFFGCRGMSWIDWRCDGNGVPHFLEINTIPGMTDASLLPKAAKHAGYDEKRLVERLVELAREE